MKNENSIELVNVKKKFKIYADKGNSMKDKMLFWKRNQYEDHWVPDDISFSIKKGEAVGLIGSNGCGKSTTLKLINKIMYPTDGKVKVNGRVSSLLELGAGFHPDMTGRENIYTNASIFGMTKKEIEEKIDDIIAFSELDEYIDNPVRTYSSGMYMRLGFSVAINVRADILLIDEILAVGDMSFQKKCFKRLKEIKNAGTTIVIVSHALGQIEQICDRCIWIDHGKISKIGKPMEVHAEYLKELEKRSQRRMQALKGETGSGNDQNTFCGREVIRSGSGKLFFTGVELFDREGNRESVFQTGEYMRVEYTFTAAKEIHKAEFAVRIYGEDDTHYYGSTSLIEESCTEEIQGKSRFVIEFDKLELLEGDFMLDVDALDENGEVLDRIHDTIRFCIQNTTGRTGICNMSSKWKLE